MDNTKKNVKLFYIILIISLCFMGFSFALFSANFIGDKEISVNIDGLNFRYSEGVQGLTIVDPEPLSNAVGMASTDYFDFDIYIANNFNYGIAYNIYLKLDTTNTISNSDVMVYLTDQNNNQIVGPTLISALSSYSNDTNSYLLYNTSITPNQSGNNTQYYRLRMWLKEDYVDVISYQVNGNTQTSTIGDKSFSFVVNVDNLTN